MKYKYRRWFARFEFKLEDFWIGAFWKWSGGMGMEYLDIWICLLPCVPLHLTRMRWSIGEEHQIPPGRKDNVWGVKARDEDCG
jgi:hypothetical protein